MLFIFEDPAFGDDDDTNRFQNNKLIDTCLEYFPFRGVCIVNEQVKSLSFSETIGDCSFNNSIPPIFLEGY